MTAQVFTADIKPRTAFSFDKEYNSVAIGSYGDTALGALGSTSTVGEVLAILNEVVGRALVTTASSTGKATSVQN